MKHHSSYLKLVVYLSLFMFLQALLLPDLLAAQSVDCQYDRTKPSIDSARKNFKITNYVCAEKELKDLLAQESLSIEDKADAHVLLASVYYAMLRNDKNKKTKVTGQFVEAFKAYSAWRGDLDIRSPEFLAMMDEARELVAKQDSAKAAVALETPETPTVSPPESKSKPWYKKWWVLGLGVGVVAVAAVALTGGGDDGDKEPPPDQTLSDFPDTPTR